MEKVLMEEQLQETAGDLVAAERALADLRTLNPPVVPAALCSPDSSEGLGQPAPGTPPQPSGSGDKAASGGGAAEVAALRAENDTLMQALVSSKLLVAELHEKQLILIHQMHHDEAAALAPRTPTAPVQVSHGGELIKAKTRRMW